MKPDDVTQATDSNESSRGQVHRGYDFETGLLSRAREWIDLFPWLRLLRALRVAGSPPLLLLTAIVLGCWLVGQKIIWGQADLPHPSMMAIDNAKWLSEYCRMLIPTSLFDPERFGWRLGATLIWSIFLWCPPAMLLAREGALLVAERSLMPLGSALTLAAGRAPAGWLAALVPMLCILPPAAAIFLVGWTSTWFVDFRSLQVFAAMIVAVIALPCGLLALGAHVAVPISWAALIVERDADPLDSLSRGYEYFFRRPVQLVFYGLLSIVILAIIGSLTSAVAWSASEIARTSLSVAGASEEIQRVTGSILWSFPVVVVLSLGWSLVGGVYLLLRQDAGNQEVEDIWQPPAEEGLSLPELPK